MRFLFARKLDLNIKNCLDLNALKWTNSKIMKIRDVINIIFSTLI